MDIDTIRTKLAEKLSSPEKCIDWMSLLDETNPGHYGVEDVEIGISFEDIWADVPQQTFTFKNTKLSFSARLGGSSDRNGSDQSFKLTVSGSGGFRFIDSNQQLDIDEFSINEHLDLY